MVNLLEKQFVASFDVDCQKTFTPLCPDELPVPEGDTIVNALNQQAQLASLRVGSKDAHNKNASWVCHDHSLTGTALPNPPPNADKYWPRHAEIGSTGFELLDGLPAVCDYDYFVWKGIELDMHPYGACYHDMAKKRSTGVIEFLKLRGIKQVIVGGLALEYCVKETAVELANAGFEVILNLGASKGLSSESIAAASKEMEGAGVQIVDSIQ